MRPLVTALLMMLLACSAAAQPSPALQSFETDSLARIVARHQGTPFLLIVWSLDCEYCQASLKTLAHKQNKNLTIVTLATDSVSDPQTASAIRQRLTKLGLQGEAWAFGSAPAEQLRYAVDPGWHGEMPRSYWFTGRGDKSAYSGVLTSALIDKFSIKK